MSEYEANKINRRLLGTAMRRIYRYRENGPSKG
jgi:hypothetical protein